MADQRPQGRQKNVVQGSASANRRGSGLGTGPVGHGVSTGGQARQNSPGQGSTGTRARGGSSLILIIIAAVVLLGGGGGLLGGLFGGGGSSNDDTSYANYATQAATSLATKAKFFAVRMMQAGLGKEDPEYTDYKYWKANGWLDKARPWKE